MTIRHVMIRNFRGIRELDWHVDGTILCLVGPGDSTKTTILDAIELAMTSQWNVALTDSDFYNVDTSATIIVDVTISGAPDELLSQDKYGLYLRGYADGRFEDDPEDGLFPVLTIRFQVNKTWNPIGA